MNGIKAALGSESFTCANVPLSLGQNTITVIAADVYGNTTTKVIHVTYERGIITTQTKYTYDRNGNFITKEEPGQTTNLTYDSQNRLISFNTPGLAETYQYDSEGRRTSVRNTSTTTYLYDGMSVILERNAAGATTASYVRNPLAPGGIGGIISSTTATQNYYHYDGLGTVTVLSNASGASTQTYSYDAFGNILAQTGTATNNRNFLSKETDSTGLVYFGARYYDPRIGRFISKDPSGMSDGPNVYLYCSNDPINAVDLWGLCEENVNNQVLPSSALAVCAVAITSSISGYVVAAVVVTAVVVHQFARYNKKGPLWNAPGMPGWNIQQYEQKQPGAYKPPPNFKNWKEKVIWAAGLLSKLFNNFKGSD